MKVFHQRLERTGGGPVWVPLCLCWLVSHHSEHAEAGPAQQVAQVGDGRVGGHPGGESSLPLGLGQLEGTPQLVQRLPAHHRPDEHPVRLQHLVDLKGRGGRRETGEFSQVSRSGLNG